MISGKVLGNYSLLAPQAEEPRDHKAETIAEANEKIERMLAREYKVYYRATDAQGYKFCFPTVEELCYQLHLKLSSVLYRHRKQKRRYPVVSEGYTIEKIGDIKEGDRRRNMRGERSRGGAQVYAYEVEEEGREARIEEKIAEVAALVGLKAGSLRSAFNRGGDVLVKCGYKITRFKPSKIKLRGQAGRTSYVYRIQHPNGQTSEARRMEAFLYLLGNMPLCTAQSKFHRKGFLEYKGYYITRIKL